MKIALLSRAMEAEWRQHGPGGGTGSQLAAAIQSAGHEVVVWTHTPGRGKPARGKLGSLPAWLIPEKNRIPWCAPIDKFLKWRHGYRKLLTDAFLLRDFLHSEGPFDVIWAMSEDPDGIAAGWARARGFFSTPLVIMIQALRYRFANGFTQFTNQRNLQQGFNQAARVVANSPMIMDRLAESYHVPREKLRWAPHNLTGSFLKTGPIAAPSPSSDRTILFLGALNEKKGADVFLQAAEELCRQDNSLLFRMTGNLTEEGSPFARQWEGLTARTSIQSRLRLLGHLSAERLIEEILSASVVALPSRFDEFSRATIECLALGTPVVVTDGMGAAHLVREHGSGVVVPAGNASALAAGIRSALDTPSYRAAAQQHQTQIRRNFTPERLAAAWIEILRDSISAASPPGSA
ncbi:MAG: glycosyltransferase family 4 protein [Verrucomicrobiae bacterium]|nr:glycosyltransferase family 4 protein [Verrucomicrobiae bacterium]